MWWINKKDVLLHIASKTSNSIVYNKKSIEKSITKLNEIESIDREGKELCQVSGLSKVPKAEVLVYLKKAKGRKVECDQVIKVRQALEKLQVWEAAVEFYLNGSSLLESQEKLAELMAAQHALFFLAPFIQCCKSESLH